MGLGADYEISRLDGSYTRDSFCSGYDEIDSYLHSYAISHQRRKLGQTWVLHRAESKAVLGYYTLSAAQVERDAVLSLVSHSLPQFPIPCVRIGKLGVDRTQQGEGLGKLLLVHALRRCREISRELGCYAVLVDALNENVRGFYLRYGFVSLPATPLVLFLPVANIPAQ